MNAVLEPLPNCLANLRIEVEADKVQKTRGAVTNNYVKYAKLPGFRAGKAPRATVEKKFAKEIEEEVSKQVLGDACREAIQEKGLRVLSLADVEDVEWAEDKSVKFRATVILQPEFELPDYGNIPITAPSEEITDKDVDESLAGLRDQGAEFPDVEPPRAAAMEDYVVVDYDGLIEGEPVHVKFPKAGKPLSHNADFWIKMTDEAFFPGYCANIVGMNVGETREFDVAVPSDFPVEGMPGLSVHYKVTLKGVKTRKEPELNDEFADSVLKGKTLEELKGIIREQLAQQRKGQIEGAKRSGVVQYLSSKVECELPTAMVRQQTQAILRDIVQENQARGITDEVLKENEQQLVGSAAQGAREKLKGTFILLRIAEKENIKVTETELRQRISQMAQRYQMTFDKMVKELQKRNAIDQIREEVLTGKTLDFLLSKVTVTTAAA